MNFDDFRVNLELKEAIEILDNNIVTASFTGKRIDYYVVYGNEKGTAIVVIVYEKHYYRAGNRLTLTVTVDNLSGSTKIHSIGGGGGEGFFSFDWGAGGSFTESPRNALKKYIIK